MLPRVNSLVGILPHCCIPTMFNSRLSSLLLGYKYQKTTCYMSQGVLPLHIPLASEVSRPWPGVVPHFQWAKHAVRALCRSSSCWHFLVLGAALQSVCTIIPCDFLSVSSAMLPQYMASVSRMLPNDKLNVLPSLLGTPLPSLLFFLFQFNKDAELRPLAPPSRRCRLFSLSLLWDSMMALSTCTQVHTGNVLVT